MTSPSAKPLPVQFEGSRLARRVLRVLGWRYDFEGLPALQGVLIAYPHTSNWDFPVAMLLKWAMGIEAKFWAKDSLFRIPLFGRWLRWIGGVPLRRIPGEGVVEQMAAVMRDKKTRSEYFWIALSPEGTRSYRPGWRSGFYHLALQAGVPLALASIDYSRRLLTLRTFVSLTGVPEDDMAKIALAFDGVTGYRAPLAAPVRLITDGDKK